MSNREISLEPMFSNSRSGSSGNKSRIILAHETSVKSLMAKLRCFSLLRQNMLVLMCYFKSLKLSLSKLFLSSSKNSVVILKAGMISFQAEHGISHLLKDIAFIVGQASRAFFIVVPVSISFNLFKFIVNFSRCLCPDTNELKNIYIP